MEPKDEETFDDDCPICDGSGCYQCEGRELSDVAKKQKEEWDSDTEYFKSRR